MHFSIFLHQTFRIDVKLNFYLIGICWPDSKNFPRFTFFLDTENLSNYGVLNLNLEYFSDLGMRNFLYLLICYIYLYKLIVFLTGLAFIAAHTVLRDSLKYAALVYNIVLDIIKEFRLYIKNANICQFGKILISKLKNIESNVSQVPRTIILSPSKA